jgi:hypothetical protein
MAAQPMMQPPRKDSGFPAALIGLVVLVALSVTGMGGCLMCYLVGRDDKPEATQVKIPETENEKVGSAREGPSGASWITNDRPYVKFIAPPGWEKNIKGDWGVFKSADGAAVFAFTTFTQPGESTARLGKAAWVLGVDSIEWRSPTWGLVGKDRFKARMAEGSCNFNGPNGYIWYATVDSGTSAQMLLIYTVSALGRKEHKDAVVTSVDSLQNR